METRFKLPAEQVDMVIAAGRDALNANTKFRAFVRSLDGSAAPMAPPPAGRRAGGRGNGGRFPEGSHGARAALNLHYREFGVLAVGDQHAARIMRDAELRLHRRHHRLRRHPAGPEHRHLALVHLRRVALVGLHHVLDADLLRHADMHRRAVHRGEARGDLDGADRIGGFSGRIETTSGPWNGPAAVVGIEVRYIGTVEPQVMWRSSMPSWISASSNENEQPSAKITSRRASAS